LVHVLRDCCLLWNLQAHYRRFACAFPLTPFPSSPTPPPPRIRHYPPPPPPPAAEYWFFVLHSHTPHLYFTGRHAVWLLCSPPAGDLTHADWRWRATAPRSEMDASVWRQTLVARQLLSHDFWHCRTCCLPFAGRRDRTAVVSQDDVRGCLCFPLCSDQPTVGPFLHLAFHGHPGCTMPPGQCLVYSTCHLHPLCQVSAVLSHHASHHPLPAPSPPHFHPAGPTCDMAFPTATVVPSASQPFSLRLPLVYT